MLDQVLETFSVCPEHDLDLMRPDQTPSSLTARVRNAHLYRTSSAERAHSQPFLLGRLWEHIWVAPRRMARQRFESTRPYQPLPGAHPERDLSVAATKRLRDPRSETRRVR